MKYIHSNETLTVPEGGEFSRLPDRAQEDFYTTVWRPKETQITVPLLDGIVG
jgi:hypothetical protein